MSAETTVTIGGHPQLQSLQGLVYRSTHKCVFNIIMFFFILHFPIILLYSIVPYTSRMEAIENKHIKKSEKVTL